MLQIFWNNPWRDDNTLRILHVRMRTHGTFDPKISHTTLNHLRKHNTEVINLRAYYIAIRQEARKLKDQPPNAISQYLQNSFQN